MSSEIDKQVIFIDDEQKIKFFFLETMYDLSPTCPFLDYRLVSHFSSTVDNELAPASSSTVDYRIASFFPRIADSGQGTHFSPVLITAMFPIFCTLRPWFLTSKETVTITAKFSFLYPDQPRSFSSPLKQEPRPIGVVELASGKAQANLGIISLVNIRPLSLIYDRPPRASFWLV